MVEVKVIKVEILYLRDKVNIKKGQGSGSAPFLELSKSVSFQN